MLRPPCLVILFLVVLVILGGVVLMARPNSDGQTVGFSIAPPQPREKIPLESATGCTYYIRSGDNLFRIGLLYGVSYNYLAQLNGIPDPNLIYAGTSISVPCTGSGGGGVPVAIPQNCGASQSYTVVPGDNLFRIAYNFKTSLDWVRSANNLYGRVLRPGMVLTIPCPNTVQYREVPPPSGDTQPIPPPATAVPPQPGATPTPPQGVQVLIQNRQFSQQVVPVLPGTTVIWTNQDTASHTIVILQNGAQVARSPSIPTGGSWWFAFNASGNFDFQFAADATVHGTVQVGNPTSNP
ncbi:MAG: LysM peptidoglycan-binding domain-containing protein [Anaerolineae bacterium]